ncbi:alpha/beta fold hydrolase [Streptomyces sp. VNUA116]|uniref:alpha/beta fold hydrolase n=1 Tax=Streptomyces sp. VNUA116 TaxID=3062449 RepID=UPI0026752D70|nr:alpha/beta fold hydrolase [Streptomyces sp. VNUA116]WKU49051.1 alpha/beta fold hydrolase [Streptomyces sp. VNUA116]
MPGDENAVNTLLLVHGAWHGSWCWERLLPALAARGLPAVTVDLPSAAMDGNGAIGLQDDVQALYAALDRVDGPVTVVAHSYAGQPATVAAAHDRRIVRLVYLAAYQLDAGESTYGFHGIPVPDPVEGIAPPMHNPREAFYSDVPAQEAEQALRRLTHQSLRTFCEPVTAVGWRDVPSTYILCEHDRALAPHDQERMAARAQSVHRLPSGHSPFLSMPDRLADLLVRNETAAG